MNVKFLREFYIPLLVLLAIVLIAGFYTYLVVSKNNINNTILTPAQSALSVDAGGTPYTDLEGNIILLSDYIGQVIVVNSWASWSPASVTELATIAKMSAEFRDNEVKFLAINRSEPANTAISFIETYKISKEITFILDHDDRFYKRIEGYNMPETVIYDREGNVFHHERGSISASKLRKLVNQALAI